MQNLVKLLLPLFVCFACTQQQGQKYAGTDGPKVVEAHGYVVPNDSISKPRIIIVDENKLVKKAVGKPTVILTNTNARNAIGPKSIVAGKPRICTPGAGTFSLPKIVPAIDKPVKAGIPEVVLAKDAYIKDQNPQNFSIYGKLQGLKHNFIRCMLQDTYGNIWFGTDGGGITKYDGKYFTHFTEKEGLGSNSVWSIVQDKSGSLWFATFNGVTKYDGKYFTSFTEKEGLSNNFVHAIIQDKNGNIWLGTDGGVCKFDGHFFTHFTEKEGLISNKINSIIQDKTGNLWFGTDDGACNFDGKTFTLYTQKEGLSSSNVISILQDKNGSLWFGTDSGVNKFDGRSFTHFTEQEGLSNNTVISILEDHGGSLWFMTFGGGVTKYDGSYFTNLTEKEGLSSNLVYCGVQDKSGNLWFGGDGGVNKFNGLSFTHFTKNEGLPNNTVYSILQDKSGSLWFGTFGGGSSKYDGKSFTHFSEKEGLCKNYIWTMLLDNACNLWFGTDHGGVAKYDGKHFTYFTENEGLSNNKVFSILQDKRGNLWFGTYHGVTKYDGKSFTLFTKKEGLNNNKVYSIIQDKAGNIWFGTDFGATQYNGETFTHFTEKEGLSNNTILTMLQDNSGNIWFGTYGDGVVKFDGKYFTHFNEKEGLSNNFVFSILQDRKGNLWFGTRDGLNKLTPNNLAKINATCEKREYSAQVFIKSYSYDDGFLGIGCKRNAIFEDNTGTIWIGANEQLTAYHPEGDEPDTIPPNTQLTGIDLFNENIAWTNLENNKDTSLGLGNGVRVKNFKFNGVTKWYNLPEDLSLAYNNNYLTFTFIGITQKQSKKVKYQYKLEGIDENWSALTNRTEAPYGNLPNGSYTFKVKAMNSEGYWSNEYKYSFTIRPPWWKTWGFRSFAIIVVVFAVAFYIKRRERKLIRDKQILEKTVQDRTKEIEQQKEEIMGINEMLEKQKNELLELDNMKTNFFTNISHEFRTPLTLIIGPLTSLIEKSKDPESQDNYQMMLRQARRLLTLINQILDLSKLRNTKMKLNISYGDISKLLNLLFSSFSSLATESTIQFNYNVGAEPLIAWFDKDKVEKMIINLVSNAFKHTPNKGQINIKLENKIEVSGCIEVSVKDSGSGIAPEDLKNIFEPFYQADNKVNKKIDGTGIGLALVKELATLHGGSISVKSECDKGTEFILKIAVVRELLPMAEVISVQDETFSISNNELINTDKEPKVTKTTDLKKDGTTILIVEDNDDMRQFIANTILGEYQVIEAINGVEGIGKAKEHNPDLIITDIMMPQMDGNEMTQQLKNNVETSHIPIIMLTAKASEDSKIESLRSYADDYITKPFNATELTLRVRNAIAHRQKLREKFQKSILVNPSEVTVNSLDEQFIEKALLIVEQHMDDSEFSAEDFCFEMGMARSQIHRKLKAIANQPVTEFIRCIRLKRAASLISQDAATISEIAYQTGFTNLSYFSKSFREYFRVSPSDYKLK